MSRITASRSKDDRKADADIIGFVVVGTERELFEECPYASKSEFSRIVAGRSF